MGLKERNRREAFLERIFDKIRPKWDWKVLLRKTGFVENNGIKSDQNGIESFLGFV